jgi:two-component system OmpR family sensor kinase
VRRGHGHEWNRERWREHVREHHRHAWNPTAWYVRRSLHRRIFYLLGASILFTGILVMFVVHFTGDHRPPGERLWPLLIFGVMLWGASGRLAHRLTRPYTELARVASEIGAGKLSARYALDGRGMDEARVLADSINDMATRIEKQMADQRELLAAVSHEIRTPLARIRLLAELMRGDPATMAKALDDLDREVVEIDALVSQLLASSRIDFAALSLRTLDAADVAARALERAGLSRDLLQVTATGTKLEADATLLARGLANLLANAETHGGGVKALSVREAADRVVFEVLDSGPGFVPGDEEKVFDSFDGRSTARSTEKGALGLGLSLVKRIAVAHGGSAFAETREEGGARVGIALPSSRN